MQTFERQATGIKAWTRDGDVFLLGPAAMMPGSFRSQPGEFMKLGVPDQQFGLVRCSWSARFGAAPLSTAQHRWWKFATEGVWTRNLSISRRLRGELDLAAFEDTLRCVILRHESLRTRFLEERGGPLQLIEGEGSPNLEIVDLTSTDEGARLTEAKAIAADAFVEAPPLSSRGLFRIKLLRLARDDHVMLVIMPHILGDAWALDLLWREIKTLYADRTHQIQERLPELQIEYGDYAIWEHNRNLGARTDRIIAYWDSSLAHTPAPLSLFANGHSPGSVPRGNIANLDFDVAPFGLLAEIHEFTTRHRTTLPSMFLTAYYAVLAQWAAQWDVLIGYVSSGRLLPQTMSLVGVLTYVQPIRLHLHGTDTFVDSLEPVKNATLNAHMRSGLPPLNHPKMPGSLRDKLENINVLFNYIKEGAALEFGGRSTNAMPQWDDEFSFPPLRRQRPMFDLQFVVRERKDGVLATIYYDSARFKPELIERVRTAFMDFFLGAIQHPTRQLREAVAPFKVS